MVSLSRRTAEGVLETRQAIASAAERLFAEHGVAAVSNRQISDAAGQGNTAAVGYHFGTKAELVRAIVRKHTQPAEQIRQRMLAEIGDSDDLRDWVACLVRPYPEHLAALGTPSWYARCAAQLMADPQLRPVFADEALARESLRQTRDGLFRCLPPLPSDVQLARSDMIADLIVLTCARRERALAEGTTTLHRSWEHTAIELTDAIVGLLLGPVTPHS
ncbi:TetR family transcriptional regulator [Streptomyces libani subsp. rufus]|nr:TetR family transcriptional regulator [Streptomyces libani subsp. rufus]